MMAGRSPVAGPTQETRRMHEFRTRRRIEFVDTDMGGIVHFSRYFIFMETAEHEFLEALGTSVALDLDGKQIGWPRVSVSCEYRSPARFGETLDIHLSVRRKGKKSMTYEVEFRVDERLVAVGRATSVCCELAPGEEVRSIPIPDFLRDRLEEAPR
jgi:4-hydroxybenzoyl-CoA thioesterase/acyl-CoA thioester hydrolase